MKKLFMLVAFLVGVIFGTVITSVIAQVQQDAFDMHCTSEAGRDGYFITCTGLFAPTQATPTASPTAILGTPVSSTPTNTPAPTNTPVPTDTATPVPPTNTPIPTNTAQPTSTPAQQPTNTPIPPTATATNVSPIPTPTNVSPIPTPTSVSPIPTPTPTATLWARGRARVVNGSLYAENGTLLRGDTIEMIGDQIMEVHTDEFWDNMLAAHLNTLRAVAQVNSSTCSGPCVESFVPQIEGAINEARSHGFYTVISYIDTSGSPSISGIQDFWGVIAPRYAYYPDIIYDVIDAPCHGDASCFDAQTVGLVSDAYDYVRQIAPDTILYAFSVEYGEGDLTGLAASVSQIDWTKTLLAYSSTYSRVFDDIQLAQSNGYPVADYDIGNCNSWSYCEGKARGDDVRNISWIWNGGSRYVTPGVEIHWPADYLTHQ